MANVVMIIILTLVVSGVGGGVGFWIWYLTRPKKITWKARCYQIGDGVKPIIKDKTGKIISDLKLTDLKPYATDVLEKTIRGHGRTIFRLQKLNITTPEVTADCVEYWGENNKIVDILIDGENATILKKGYDKRTGTEIFRPMRQDRINTITENMLLKKDRLTKEKDILTAITPWVVTGMAVIGLVLITYIIGNALLKISEVNSEGLNKIAEKVLEITGKLENVCSNTKDLNSNLNTNSNNVQQNPPK